MAKQTAGAPIPPVPEGSRNGNPMSERGDNEVVGPRPSPGHGHGHGGPAGSEPRQG
jgi:hypothetical protein